MTGTYEPGLAALLKSRNFPELKNDLILRVVRGEKVEKLPVWIMRQAGRYLPEFREFRKLHGFFEICRNPELACEVTLMPIKRYNLDAAIIFSDIMVVPAALGMEVVMEPNIGPSFPDPLTIDTIDSLKLEGALERLSYVGDAITLTRHNLDGIVPLLGFSGAPWTLMAYMVEGGGSKTYSKAKRWLYAHPKEAHRVLGILEDIISEYLIMQVEHGAQMLQVFESSGEYLDGNMFQTFCAPYLISIKHRVRDATDGKVPLALFVKGGSSYLDIQASLGYDVVGLDWMADRSKVRGTLADLDGPELVIQGNLDPCALYAPDADLRKMVVDMIDEMGSDRYIVNLGHGIYPDAPVSAVETLIDSVHTYPM